jgi:hypothetical protein
MTYNSAGLTYTGAAPAPILEKYYSGVGTGSMRGAIARSIKSMSFMMWKILRRLPKPLLLVLSLFLLAAEARS